MLISIHVYWLIEMRKKMQPKNPMSVVSVNVGLPREVIWRGETISTGIFKQPVQGRVAVRRLNLDGDRQADLTVHGGPDKAIYAYPAEYYHFWREEFPDIELPWAMFGENVTVEGLLDDTVHIGDRFRMGSAGVMVTQPRVPCYKLGIKFGRDDIIKRFLASGFTGFYFSVLEEGEVAAGDAITLIERDEHRVKVSDITRLYAQDKSNVEALQRAVELEALAEDWRSYFQKRLRRLSSRRQAAKKI
jgi:MOSC domain-containing protein YiiM